MRTLGALLILAFLAWSPARAAPLSEMARWRSEAAAVSIVRDDWGIAHVTGKTDADAVFGMIYAQAEDDFPRVEANYLTALGRTAEAEGESAIFADLRQKLFVDPADLKARYDASPAWLKRLMNAWADGLNYYLATHPKTASRVIKHFEPWMVLSFTEGSIGGDIERISLGDLEAFYGGHKVAVAAPPPAETGFIEPTGSNGFAIAPANTRDHHALLWINPHTSFFFRSELQARSGEGLDAYGAVTWGQFFIYQGFNEKAGWMHTSSGVDVVDEFAETIVQKGGGYFYRYGTQLRPVKVSIVKVPYRTASGALAERSFTTFRTHHGPIVRAADGKWITFAMMYRPVEALSQSFLRTKAHDYAAFLKVAELKANSSNNTIFADAAGEIAYLHPQFIPRRDGRFDYTQPVDGADPATDWHGLLPLGETPHVLSPANGWIANSNNAPWYVAAEFSPRAEAYPSYMDTAGQNPRGVHSAMLLTGRHDFTPESLRDAAFDSYLPAFARLIPSLTAAYDATPDADPLKARLADQIALLRGWDDRWSADSAATSLAVFWGEQLWSEAAEPAKAAHVSVYDYMQDRTTAAQKLAALTKASDRLAADFGSWKTPWGQINRFQRNDGAITQIFDDARPSLPVPFTSGQWGSLASFGAGRHNGTKRYYGTSGNSFVAVVEFGPKVRALAVTAGGESGDPASPHFNDQVGRYISGNLREVYFYPEQLEGHTERSYHPGE